MEDLREKQERLTELLKSLKSVAVAYSSGVDSSFLLKSAQYALGSRVLAVTALFGAFPAREARAAEGFARAYGVERVCAELDVFQIDGFAENPPDRCYRCKKVILQKTIEAARERGMLSVVEGSNADDAADYRPGLKAVEELGVRSPLREAGLTKEEVRTLSRRMGLETWDVPSYACLATRFPYGEPITGEKLAMVEEAEDYLLSLGLSQVRVRVHGGLARVEVGRQDFRRLMDPERMKEVNRFMRSLGFRYAALDMEGYRTGSMNPDDGQAFAKGAEGNP